MATQVLETPLEAPTNPATPKWNRRSILHLLREEADLILARAADPAYDKPIYGLENLRWYLDLSKDWGVVTLGELLKQTPGKLLDIGAYYGLISGAAIRAGWKVCAVDQTPMPSFSGLSMESRGVEKAICNVCVDSLPYADTSFDALLCNEVLEHLVYAPHLFFREIRRVLRPGGRLYLTTPNPAAISKLIRLARGKNNEPHFEIFWREDDAYDYKGRTFFKSMRETRLWTVDELKQALSEFGLKVVDHYYYGNTVTDGELLTAAKRVRFTVNRWIRDIVKRNRLMGGGTIVVAVKA